VKRESSVRERGYLLTPGDWSLKVGNKKHNHEMTDGLKGHKATGRPNPNESIHLRELTDSKVPLRHILTNLRNRNNRASSINNILGIREHKCSIS